MARRKQATGQEMVSIGGIDAPQGTTKDGRSRLKRLKPEHIESTCKAIAPMVAAGEGYGDIAEKLYLSVGQVTRLVKSDAFTTALANYRETIAQQSTELLWGSVPSAIKTLDELSKGARSEHVRFEAANAILAHSGIDNAASGRSGADEQLGLIAELMAQAIGRSTEQQANLQRPIISVQAGGQVILQSAPAALPMPSVINGEVRELPAETA